VTRKMLMPASWSNPPSRSHMPNRRTNGARAGQNKGVDQLPRRHRPPGCDHKQKLVAAPTKIQPPANGSDAVRNDTPTAPRKRAGTIAVRRNAAVVFRQHTAHAMPVIATSSREQVITC